MADVVLLDTAIVSIFLKVAKVHDERRRKIEDYLRGKIALRCYSGRKSDNGAKRNAKNSTND